MLGWMQARHIKPSAGEIVMRAKWKPSKGWEDEYNISCYPSMQIEGRIGIDIINETKTRTIHLWMSTKEAKKYGNAIIEACEKNERIQGIRNQDFIFRWM